MKLAKTEIDLCKQVDKLEKDKVRVEKRMAEIKKRRAKEKLNIKLVEEILKEVSILFSKIKEMKN